VLDVEEVTVTVVVESVVVESVVEVAVMLVMLTVLVNVVLVGGVGDGVGAGVGSAHPVGARYASDIDCGHSEAWSVKPAGKQQQMRLAVSICLSHEA